MTNFQIAVQALKNNPQAVTVEITDTAGLRVELPRHQMDVIHTETVNQLEVRTVKVVFNTGKKKRI